MKPCVTFVVAVLFCETARLSAQSLAEVARRERQRRENLRNPEGAGTSVDPRPASNAGGEILARELEAPAREAPQRRASPPANAIAPRKTAMAIEAPEVIPVRVTPTTPEPRARSEPVNVGSASPQSRKENLERGYALLESSQYPEAANAFREVLRRAPLDREARLGLGRVYVRSGEDAAARREFESVLLADPADAEAMLGIAQTYQWSGVGPMAREWYERALAIAPGHEGAEVGLAYVELWREPAIAAERAVALGDRFPGSVNVQTLRQEAEKVRAPQYQVSYDRLTDTHQNQIDVAWMEGRMGLSSGWDLRLGGALYDMTFGGEEGFGDPGSGSIASAYTVLGRPTAPGQRIDLRVGLDQRKDTLGATDFVAIGGAAWSWGLDRKWSGRVAFDRDSFRYTTKALDDGIALNVFSASLSNRFATSWLAEGEMSYWDIDDELGIGNRRLSAGGGLRYNRLFKRAVHLEAGYDFLYFSYRANFGASFFSPSSYRGNRFDVVLAGPIGSIFEYHASGATGIQSYDRVSNEPMWTVRATLGARLGSGYRLEVFGIRGDYLFLTDFPVTSEQFGVRLRWQAGGVR